MTSTPPSSPDPGAPASSDASDETVAATPEPAPSTADAAGDTGAAATTTATAPPTTGTAATTGALVALLVGLLGAVALIGSVFLDWQDVDGLTASGTDVPAEFLVDSETGQRDPGLLESLFSPLVVAGALAAAGALLRHLRMLGILGGALGVAVVVMYCVQVDSLLADAEGVGLFDFIGIGTYVALAGAVVAIVAAVLPRGADT